LPRGLPAAGAGGRARVPDADRRARGHRPRLRAADAAPPRRREPAGVKSLKYWWAAFNARPFGMPIPPNWFGIAAFAMLGGFVNPGFWLVGAALEIGYLAALAGNRRFRTVVDIGRRGDDPVDSRYTTLLGRL